MANISFTATSNTVGTGNFTFNEDVSENLVANDVFNAFISINVPFTWNYGQNTRDVSWFESSEATYLGDGVFSRDVIKSSSNSNLIVNFPAGVKTVVVKPLIQPLQGVTFGIGIVNANVVNANTVNVTGEVVANTIGVANVSANNIAVLNNLSANVVSVGANVVANTTTLRVGNTTVNTVISNTQIAIGNTTVNSVVNSTAVILANSTVSFSIIKSTSAQVTAGNYFLGANSVWQLLSRVGELVFFTGDSPPAWGLEADASSVSRTTYSRLWAWVQTSGNLAASQGAKTAGEYGPGDGSTTFTLPDLITGGRFIRAATTVGTLQDDAAPDIWGAFQSVRCLDASSIVWGDDGAFFISGGSGSNAEVLGEPGGALLADYHEFYASGYDAKYGAATEIRPINVSYLPIIIF